MPAQHQKWKLRYVYVINIPVYLLQFKLKKYKRKNALLYYGSKWLDRVTENLNDKLRYSCIY